MTLLTRRKMVRAVVEVSRPDAASPWPLISDPGVEYVRLHAGVGDEEIGSVMLTACLYNRTEISSDAAETLRHFLAGGGFVLPGGLLFAEGDEVKVVPGCCCGLEDWVEWRGVPHGNNAVWTGHDPGPEVEYVGGAVRVWPGEKEAGGEFVEFTMEELGEWVLQVEADLAGFVYRLGKWAEYFAPGLEQRVVRYFVENMHVPVGRTEQ